MTYPNEIFTVFAFLGFLVCIIPLPWHLEAWNVGTCLYMIWTAIGCLNQFINSIVWKGNAINWAPVWCDISSRIMIALTMAIPACSLCITRRLYAVASVGNSPITASSGRRNNILVDLAIGIGLPILQMILYYIPQGHRFDIFEDIGCYPFVHMTWMGLVAVSLPPIIVGLASMVYSVLSIIAFNKNRAELDALFSYHHNLTANRYVRLMCLAGVDALLNVPLATWVAVVNFKDGFAGPFTWESTHLGFSRVDQYPAIYWHASPPAVFGLEFSRWAIVVCAFIFFSLFGFADEATRHYHEYAYCVGELFGARRKNPTDTTFTDSEGISTVPEICTTERVHPFCIQIHSNEAAPSLMDPKSPSDDSCSSSYSTRSNSNSKLSATTHQPSAYESV